VTRLIQSLDSMAEGATQEGMNGLHDFLNVPLREAGDIDSSEMFVVMKARSHWTLLPTRMRRAWSQRPGESGLHARDDRSRGEDDFMFRSVVRVCFSFWGYLGVLMC
jgi:hypothetical protein